MQLVDLGVFSARWHLFILVEVITTIQLSFFIFGQYVLLDMFIAKVVYFFATVRIVFHRWRSH